MIAPIEAAYDTREIVRRLRTLVDSGPAPCEDWESRPICNLHPYNGALKFVRQSLPPGGVVRGIALAPICAAAYGAMRHAGTDAAGLQQAGAALLLFLTGLGCELTAGQRALLEVGR